VLAAIGRGEVPVLSGGPAAASGESAAVDWLVALLRRTPEPVTVVATGPLTDVAAALRREPTLVDAVAELVVMGGNFTVEVAGPVERNTGNDPAALETVLATGLRRLVLVPLDATYQAPMGAAEITALRALGTPAAALAADYVEERIEVYRSVPGMHGRAPVHDPLTIAHLLDPAVVELSPRRVAVDRTGRTSLLDGAANALVALGCDAARFRSLLFDTLG
jgi:inosine-uridine nucleoside N-ribohydrolase